MKYLTECIWWIQPGLTEPHCYLCQNVPQGHTEAGTSTEPTAIYCCLSQFPNGSTKQFPVKDWLTGLSSAPCACRALQLTRSPLAVGKTRPLCISTAYPTRSSSSQISMTLTPQEFCKQLVMLVIVRVVCSEIKCHGAICVWICHNFHSHNYFRHTVNQQCNMQSQMINTSKPGHYSRETEKRAHFTWVFYVHGWWEAAPTIHHYGWSHLTTPLQCPQLQPYQGSIPHSIAGPASAGPDCGMPVAASVMKVKPGALCNLQSPRRKNKHMHNPPASVSR